GILHIHTVVLLDGPRRGVVGVGNVVGSVIERFAGAVGKLLKPGAGPANGVVPTVTPGNVRFAVHVFPLAVMVVHRFEGFAILLERDLEGIAAAVAHIPFAEEAAVGRCEGVGRGWFFGGGGGGGK